MAGSNFLCIQVQDMHIILQTLVPRGNLLIQVSSWEVNLRNKTVCNIISIFLELLGFDDLIGFKSGVEKECHDIDEPACGMGGELGSKIIGFAEKTALMSHNLSCLEAIRVSVLHFVVDVDFAISTEVIKLLFDASALQFVLLHLHTIDYVQYILFILFLLFFGSVVIVFK